MERPKTPAKSSKSTKKGPASITALPKGAIDEGEKPEQTALREVHEETGLGAELVHKLSTSNMFMYAAGAIRHASSRS